MKKSLMLVTSALLAVSFSFNASANSRGGESTTHQAKVQEVTIIKSNAKHDSKHQQIKKVSNDQKVVIVQKNKNSKNNHKVVRKQPTTSFSISIGNGLNTSIVIAQNDSQQNQHKAMQSHQVINVIR